MSPSSSKTPTVSAELGELLPLVCAVAIYGPPVLFLLVPWLCLGVLLSAPFALAVLVIAALAAATTLVAGLVTLLRGAAA
jgi:hypothetical protein